MLAGLIPTSPEESLTPERVDPLLQDEQRFPGLDRLAIRSDGAGWQVPEPIKRKVIEKAAEVLFERRTTFDKDGNEIEAAPDRAAEAQASRTLLAADERQWDRDHPRSKDGDGERGPFVLNINVETVAKGPRLIEVIGGGNGD